MLLVLRKKSFDFVLFVFFATNFFFSFKVNGRLVLEGALRIYWGVVGVIHLKEEYDQRTVVTVRKRNSYRLSNGSLNVSNFFSPNILFMFNFSVLSFYSYNTGACHKCWV